MNSGRGGGPEDHCTHPGLYQKFDHGKAGTIQLNTKRERSWQGRTEKKEAYPHHRRNSPQRHQSLIFKTNQSTGQCPCNNQRTTGATTSRIHFSHPI